MNLGQHSLSDEERTRMIGARDGLAHSLIALRNVKMSITGPRGSYLPPARHHRKLKQKLNELRHLEDLEKIIMKKHEAVKEAIK